MITANTNAILSFGRWLRRHWILAGAVIAGLAAALWFLFAPVYHINRFYSPRVILMEQTSTGLYVLHLHISEYARSVNGGKVPAFNSKSPPLWVVEADTRMPYVLGHEWTYEVPPALVGKRLDSLHDNTPLVVIRTERTDMPYTGISVGGWLLKTKGEQK